jgi:hypothetical protein
MAKVDEKFIMLLDMQKVLSNQEMADISSKAQKQHAEAQEE